ncbi:hypothetical protein MVEN_00591700 [Mycena venus]|uniref:Uncharacterized protein n=1 Tax=Mycena venus TaxID=2733690 RepID=A0A8H7D7N2_9AGAR|nr:hypothetical protein MVEN_00591700 [Mycena venus]
MYQASTLVNFFVVLAAVPLLVTASPVQLPRSFDNLPSGTHALAFDSETGRVSAYTHNGAFLAHVNQTVAASKRAGGTCSNLGPNDLTGLAGWNLVAAQAAANWGNGKYNLATNINNEADYPALACVSDDRAMEIPSCVTSTQTSSGTLVGTSGSVTLSALEGTSSTTTITTTKTSDWSLGVSVAATIGIPDIVDTTTTVSTSISITNSLSNAYVLEKLIVVSVTNGTLSVTTASNNQQTQTITMNAADGATCSLTFTSKSCTGSGTGSIVMVAKGWAWFEYEKKVNGHYYWALNIEAYIPDASQRSSSIDFTAAISATNDSQYKGTCT